MNRSTAILFALLLTSSLFAQPGPRKTFPYMDSGTAAELPITCPVPSFYLATDTGNLYVCNANIYIFVTSAGGGFVALSPSVDQTLNGGFSLINNGGRFRTTNSGATPSTSTFDFFVNGSGRGSIAFSGSGSSTIFFDVDGGLVFNPASASAQKITYNNAGVFYSGSSASFPSGISCASAPHGLCSAVYQQPIRINGNTSGGTVLYAQDIAESHAIGLPAADGTLQITNLSTPANSSATCTAGQIWNDASFIYACTAANTIKRSALSSF